MRTHGTFLTLKTEPTEGHFQMSEMGFKKHISDSAMAKLRSLSHSVSVGSMDAGIPIIFLMSWMINIHYI